MDAPGIAEENSAIWIKIDNKKFKNIPKNWANGIQTKEIKYTMNPNIVVISIIGPAKIFEIQNVKEVVLKKYAITGIMIIFADMVMLSESIKYLVAIKINLVKPSCFVLTFHNLASNRRTILLYHFNISF